MDFFAQQESARRRSVWLTVAALAFASVVVAVTGLVFTVAAWCGWGVIVGHVDPFWDFIAQAPYVVIVAYALAFVVTLMNALVACQNTSSGDAMMQRVGARRARRTEEPRLFNVVEEMSLASGADMPTVWVADDDEGVNAFVAGYGGGDAALCLTAGALKYLTRDELQGVVAHEFGHILNGDMRFNSHLAMLVEGLDGIAALGRTMLRPITSLFGPESEGEDFFRGQPSRGGLGWGNTRGSGALFSCLSVIYIVTGCLLWLIGCVGELFARLLQRAASRAREYLADAAAVQFTRNPEGLADALRFTRLLAGRSWRFRNASVANICHMFFVGEMWGVDGTHPSVRDRVQRLSRLGLSSRDSAFRVRIATVRRDRKLREQSNYERYRQKQDAHSKLVRESVSLPPELNARLKSAAGAGAVLCALLRNEPIEGGIEPMTHAERRELAYRAVSAIRTWGSDAEIAAWRDRIEGLMKGEDEIGSFAFAVWCSIRRRLRNLPPAKIRRPGQLVREAAGTVATVASFGKDPRRACELAATRLEPFFPRFLAFVQPYDSVSQFIAALDALRSLSAPVKRELLFAIRSVIAEDDVVTDDESNYLSAIADAIGADGWDLAV